MKKTLEVIEREGDLETPFAYRPDSCDKNVWRAINFFNEYDLPDVFPDGSLIFDIGGHIGSFSYACALRGAGRIVAAEIDQQNRELYQKNLSGFDGVYTLVDRAVGGNFSSAVRFTGYSPGGEGETNTGGGNVFTGSSGEMYMDESGRMTFQPVAAESTLPLDELVELHGVPDVLKLDCEGSEWPILFNSDCIKDIPMIVGEFHEGVGLFNNNNFHAAMDGKTPGIEALETYLKSLSSDHRWDRKFYRDEGTERLGVFVWENHERKRETPKGKTAA